ncbi:myb-related protein [Sesbania bispinosa]|nr:myb-related protein [Sesbania bispinosa]
MEQKSSLTSHSSMTHMNLGNSAESSISSMSTSFNIPSLSPSSPPQMESIDSANHLSTMTNPSNSSPRIPSNFHSHLKFNNTKMVLSMCLRIMFTAVPIQDTCYVDTNNNYGLEGLNLDPLSSMETYDISQFDFQTAGSGWMLDNMGDTLWNMDAI